MDEKTIRITNFKGEKYKQPIWSEKFIARAGIKGYYVLLIGARKIPADDTDKTKEK